MESVKKTSIESSKIEVKKTEVLSTVRQYFYKNEQYSESLISTLERTYKDGLKTDNDWSAIMKAKKIIF